MAEATHDPRSQVPAEIQAGDGLSLTAAGRPIPGHRGGKSVSGCTVFRWVTSFTTTAPHPHTSKTNGPNISARQRRNKGISDRGS